MTAMTRVSRPAFLATTFLAAAVTGCAPAARPAGETAVDPGIVLVVRNDNWLQVDVYLLRATARHRLGSVSSMSTQVFRIPRALYAASGTVQLLADPIGTNQTFRTEPIPVGQTRQIELTVAEYLPFSRLMLR